MQCNQKIYPFTGAQLRAIAFDSSVMPKIKQFLREQRAERPQGYDWILVASAAMNECPDVEGWGNIIDAFIERRRGLVAEVRAQGKAAQEMFAAELEKGRPLIDVAAQRYLALVGRIDQLKAQIERGKNDASRITKRAELAAHGVQDAELDRLAPVFNGQPLQDEIAALTEEMAMLNAFLRTHDEDYLSAEFIAAANEFIAHGAPREFAA